MFLFLLFLSQDSVGRKSEGDIAFTKQPSLKEGIVGWFLVCVCVFVLIVIMAEISILSSLTPSSDTHIAYNYFFFL